MLRREPIPCGPSLRRPRPSETRLKDASITAIATVVVGTLALAGTAATGWFGFASKDEELAQARAEGAAPRAPASRALTAVGADEVVAAPLGDGAPFTPAHGIGGIKKTIEDAL